MVCRHAGPGDGLSSRSCKWCGLLIMSGEVNRRFNAQAASEGSSPSVMAREQLHACWLPARPRDQHPPIAASGHGPRRDGRFGSPSTTREPVRFPAFANLLIDYMRVLVTTCYNPGPVE
jgi:hypothetical protein